ncbi:MAG: MFS transporter [Rubellimicrobium sp.]|nr:MFS transporter [Rubellimicrobium sp.]
MSAASGRPALIFIFVTVLLDVIGFGIIMPVMPALIEEVGGGDIGSAAAIFGWMAVAFSLAQFLFAPLMGSLSDAFGRRPLLLLAIAGLALDHVVFAVAPTLLWLFVARVIAGACGASVVIANAYVADITAPEGRARAFGLLGAAFGVGFILGPAMGGLLGAFGTRVPFWVAAGLAALNFLFGLRMVPESLPQSRRRAFDWRRANPFGVFRVFAAYGNVLPLLGVLALYFFGSTVYPAIWAFWGTARFGWSEAMIGATLALYGVCSALVQGGLAGPASRWLGEGRVVLLSLVLGTVMALAYGMVGSTLGVVILTLLHAPEELAFPTMNAILSRAAPEDAQGELQGGIAAASNLTMMLGTLFFAQVFARSLDPARPETTSGTAFFVAAAIIALSLVAFFRLRRRGPLIPDAPGGAPGGATDPTTP